MDKKSNNKNQLWTGKQEFLADSQQRQQITVMIVTQGINIKQIAFPSVVYQLQDIQWNLVILASQGEHRFCP